MENMYPVAGSLTPGGRVVRFPGDFDGDRAESVFIRSSWRSVAGGELQIPPLRSSAAPVGMTREEWWLTSEAAIGMCGFQMGE
jgi:hypothetical protein